MAELHAHEGVKGVRLDRFLQEEAGLSRAAVQRMITEGAVTVGGKPRAKSYRLRADDCILFTPPDTRPPGQRPEEIPLDILYEDSDLLVVNKPKGMVVHPAPGNSSGTLVNALLYHCGDTLSGIGGVMRPGILHRIDKDTSGLLLVAKNDAAHIFLSDQIKEHSFDREYETVVIGSFSDDTGTIDAPIGRCPTNRKRMAVTADGKPARTHYTVVERFDGFTRLRVRLETGRTHQIRVHMAYLGRPVLGDPVYGNGKNRFEAENRELLAGQCLHARVIGFVHPDGRSMHFESGLPAYFEEILRKLRNAYKS